MACLEKLGTIVITDAMKKICVELRDKHQFSRFRDIESLYHYYSFDGKQDIFSNHLGIDLSGPLGKDYYSTQLFSAEPVEMHSDENFNCGILIMVSTPQGATLIQKTGAPIELGEGDIVRIKYKQNHGLLMHPDQKLIFIAYDYSRQRKEIEELWKGEIKRIAA